MNLDQQQAEEWRIIKDFPDYAVSDMGRVKRIKGNILNGSKNTNGYILVVLICNGIRKSKLIHRLVLENFIGPCPDNHQCNHKDGIKQNNSLPNLEWVTRSENMRHSYGMGLHPLRSGQENHNAKLKNNEAWLIKKLLSSGKIKQKIIAKMFRVTPETISYINCGMRFKKVECKDFEPNKRKRLLATGLI